jgi:predicted lysophospholipase L1 biosynthesis ABC-type transport system permease subunit
VVNAQPAVGVFAVVYAAGAAAGAARRSAGSLAAAASPESPNYFLINIAPEQVTPLKGFLSEHHIIRSRSIPSFARLTQINGQPTEGNKDESLNRELNLTWQEKRPDHNPITAGTWPPKAGEVSMEEGWRRA